EIRNDAGEWQTVSWDAALDRAAELLRHAPAEEIGCLVSPRATNEELYLAQKITRDLGSQNIDHRLRQVDFSDQEAAPLAPGMGLPIKELAQADGILLIGSNIRHEQPILGHKVRQAWREGARVAAINPVDYKFHFDLTAQAVGTPFEMLGVLAAAVKASGGKLPTGVKALAADGVEKAVADLLDKAERGVVIFGHTAAAHPRAGTLRLLARRLAEQTGAAFCEPPASANTAGAWRLGVLPHRGPGGRAIDPIGLNVREMVEQARSAYLVHDFEPGADSLYGPAMRKALAAARTVYLGAFDTEEIRSFADVILPLAVAPEVDGSLTNADGESQTFLAAGTPPGDARAGWKVLRVLGNALALQGFEYTRIEQVRAEYEEILAAADEPPAKTFKPEPVKVPEGLQVVADLPIYATDGLVRRAGALQETAHGLEPEVRLAAEDARDAGLKEGDQARVNIGDDRLVLRVSIDPRIAAGSVWLPAGVVAFDATAVTCTLGEG
ncbi:MAG: molybdopterin-dependent oxidoreductase, partial [Xanthomonadales bacterium]|nr:molybdopterin-dependent oxidoreductase [Xanthomonadales bacterium]